MILIYTLAAAGIICLVVWALQRQPEPPSPLAQTQERNSITKLNLEHATLQGEFRNTGLSNQVSEDQLLAQRASHQATRSAAEEAGNRGLTLEVYLKVREQEASLGYRMQEEKLRMYLRLEEKLETARLARDHAWLENENQIEIDKRKAIAAGENNRRLLENGDEERSIAIRKMNKEAEREDVLETYRNKIRTAAEAREERKNQSRNR